MDTVSVSLVSAVVAILATLYTVQRNSKKDTQQSTSDNVAVKEEIKYISKGIEDIKYDTKSLTSSISLMNERLIRAEVDIKNINEKIDRHIEKDGK